MTRATEVGKQVEYFWNGKPCDSDRSEIEKGSTDYFLDIERLRYGEQAHVKEILDSFSWEGKQVLEIGTGVGTDARYIAAHGGSYTGINIDRGSVEMTAAALKRFLLPGRVEQADATALPYASASFDRVYSWGVLHHIPEVDKAIAEIFRVLKPGGELLIMVYNRSSINYHVEIRLLRRLFRYALLIPGMVGLCAKLGFPRAKLTRHRELWRQLGSMSAQEWLNRNTDGPDNPYSVVYGRHEIEKLLRDFDIQRNQVYFFHASHWGPLGRLLPPAWVQALGKRWGWHRVVLARKPLSG